MKRILFGWSWKILEMEKEIRGGVSIVKNPSRGIQWYEQYRVTDEEILKKVNDIWMEIIKRRR